MRTYRTKKYKRFKFLELNRKLLPNHIRKLSKSIQKWGNLSVILMVKTACITGMKEIFIVDGQHRFKALQGLGKEIEYKFVDIDDKRELAAFIATVNNTQKSWSLYDYLHVWSKIGIGEYQIVKNKYESTGMALSIVIQFYGLKADSRHNDKFKNGNFEIPNIEKSLYLMSIYHECTPYLPDDYHGCKKEFATWIITNRPNKDKLVDIVKNNKIPLEEVSETLDRLYNQN